MSELIDKLAEELRDWEKLLEHHGTAVYLKSGAAQDSELRRLKEELDIFFGKIRQLIDKADSEWEATKATLEANLEALDTNIKSWIERTS